MKLSVVVMASALLPGIAVAEPIRLGYSAPPECPGPDAFQDRVVGRLIRGSLAQDGELARTYSVRVAHGREGYTAILAFVNMAATASRSSIHGETCQEVFDAAVVATALAIESNAVVGDDSPPAEAPEEGANLRPPDGAFAPAAPTAPTIGPPVFVSPPADRRRARESKAGAPFAMGAQVGLHSGFAPEPAFGVGVFVEARDRQGWTARVGATYAGSDVTRQERSAAFSFVAGSVDGCAPHLDLDVVKVSLCARVEAGAVRAAGREGDYVVKAVSNWSPWAAPGGALRVELEPNWAVTLFAQGSGVLPLIRERFDYQTPPAVMHEVPIATWAAVVGGGYRFQ